MRNENHLQATGHSRFLLLNGDSELSLHMEVIGANYYSIPQNIADKIPTKIPRLTNRLRKRSTSSRKGSKNSRHRVVTSTTQDLKETVYDKQQTADEHKFDTTLKMGTVRPKSGIKKVGESDNSQIAFGKST